MSTVEVTTGGEDEFPFIEFMVKKIKQGWGKVKEIFSRRSVKEVTEDGVVTPRQGFLWLLYQVTKLPHWAGIGIEYGVKGVVNIATLLIALVGAAVWLTIMTGWGAYNIVAFVVTMSAALLAVLLSTPYTAMSGGKDAIKGDWFGLKQRFLRPFRSLRSSFNRTLNKSLTKVADKVEEQAAEADAETTKGVSIVAPSPDGESKSQTPPKGRPTPARKSAHRQVTQRLSEDGQDPSDG